jgi:uncharacterized protein with HEPN domain
LTKFDMSKKRNQVELKDYLNDILEMIDASREFTENLTQAEFKKDKKAVFAVIRCLEVIGEASKKIPSRIKKDYKQIPWEDIAAMRNKLIHEYFGADVDIVWNTVQEDFNQLEKVIQEILRKNI